MITVFSNSSGYVSSFIDPVLPARSTLRLQNWGGFFGFKSIISRVMVSANGNYNFLHTLGQQVYLYVFGDRIGELQISGISFDGTCDDPVGTLGVERVLNYYARHRVAAREVPIKISIGVATTLQAYLLGITTDSVDPKSRIWQFTMKLALIPVDDSEDDNESTAELGTKESSSTLESDGPTTIELGGKYPDLPSASSDRGGVITNVDETVDVVNKAFASVNTGPNTRLVLPFTR